MHERTHGRTTRKQYDPFFEVAGIIIAKTISVMEAIVCLLVFNISFSFILYRCKLLKLSFFLNYKLKTLHRIRLSLLHKNGDRNDYRAFLYN